MDYKKFTNETIMELNQEIFELLKDTLVEEYLSFDIISVEDVTQEILAEKVCDYFEKLEFKTNKKFEKQLEIYIKDLDSIIVDYIEKTPKSKKKDAPPMKDCRARKYYNKAGSVKNSKKLSITELLDYTRIMLCLYTAIMNNHYKEISNFNYALECLEPNRILESMKHAKDTSAIKFGKKRRFDIRERYCSDTGTFIITIILLYRIINSKVQGDYDNE